MKFKILEKQTPFKRFFQIDIYQFQHELYAGGWSNTVTREVFERGRAVAVLLHDPVADTLLMVEQFRPGAIKDPDGPWMLEIVAGMVEEGEEDQDVARREAMEEANCEVTDMEFIMDYYPSAGGSTELIALYYAAVDLSNIKTGIHGLDTENEDIRTSIVPRETAMQYLKQGKIKASLAIIALQWLALEKPNANT
ncbi:NUDIX domain-containing protein [Leucothrix mucor]|uniref:NUDIX domain-containing protein n=1 Tax=Leucothrix mucor TaxID=45248 RepID=UPI0003B45963|nr:NUDIX domain-containing protein [Leucothrix mucor]